MIKVRGNRIHNVCNRQSVHSPSADVVEGLFNAHEPLPPPCILPPFISTFSPHKHKNS